MRRASGGDRDSRRRHRDDRKESGRSERRPEDRSSTSHHRQHSHHHYRHASSPPRREEREDQRLYARGRRDRSPFDRRSPAFERQQSSSFTAHRRPRHERDNRRDYAMDVDRDRRPHRPHSSRRGQHHSSRRADSDSSSRSYSSDGSRASGRRQRRRSDESAPFGHRSRDQQQAKGGQELPPYPSSPPRYGDVQTHADGTVSILPLPPPPYSAAYNSQHQQQQQQQRRGEGDRQGNASAPTAFFDRPRGPAPAYESVGNVASTAIFPPPYEDAAGTSSVSSTPSLVPHARRGSFPPPPPMYSSNPNDIFNYLALQNAGPGGGGRGGRGGGGARRGHPDGLHRQYDQSSYMSGNSDGSHPQSSPGHPQGSSSFFGQGDGGGRGGGVGAHNWGSGGHGKEEEGKQGNRSPSLAASSSASSAELLETILETAEDATRRRQQQQQHPDSGLLASNDSNRFGDAKDGADLLQHLPSYGQAMSEVQRRRLQYQMVRGLLSDADDAPGPNDTTRVTLYGVDLSVSEEQLESMVVQLVGVAPWRVRRPVKELIDDNSSQNKKQSSDQSAEANKKEGYLDGDDEVEGEPLAEGEKRKEDGVESEADSLDKVNAPGLLGESAGGLLRQQQEELRNQASTLSGGNQASTNAMRTLMSLPGLYDPNGPGGMVMLEFQKKESAAAAVRLLNGAKVNGRCIAASL